MQYKATTVSGKLGEAEALIAELQSANENLSNTLGEISAERDTLAADKLAADEKVKTLSEGIASHDSTIEQLRAEYVKQIDAINAKQTDFDKRLAQGVADKLASLGVPPVDEVAAESVASKSNDDLWAEYRTIQGKDPRAAGAFYEANIRPRIFKQGKN